MNRAEKVQAQEKLRSMLAQPGAVVAVGYSGLNVARMSRLRGELKRAGGSFTVVKNRLARSALEGRGGEAAEAMFVGPVALACSADVVVAPRIVCDFANDNEQLIVIGALVDNDVLDRKGVQALASLPSLHELRGSIAGLLREPARRIAGMVSAPAAGLARVIAARPQSSGG